MKHQKEHITQIKKSFEYIQTKGDLLQLMNDVKPILYGDNAVPFKLKQLTWYSNPKICGKRYVDFTIKKKSGKQRSIHAPVNGLKALQTTIAYILQCVFEPHKAAMGFVKDKSIVDNARIHEESNYVFNIDLKDFFFSIDQARVWKCFQLKPFNLSNAYDKPIDAIKWEVFKKDVLKTDKNVKFFLKQNKNTLFKKTVHGTLIASKNLDPKKDIFVIANNYKTLLHFEDTQQRTFRLVNKLPEPNKLQIANILAALCCTEMEVERKNENGDWVQVKRNVLPQGAPTSPVITNIVCQRLDYLLTGVAKRFGLKYSRYADDITFSSMHNVYQKDGDFLKELYRIIDDQGFQINPEKTRLQKKGYRQEVTGLLVNKKANVQKRYIKQLRMWLYYWESYGYTRASEFFSQQYIADKGHTKPYIPEMMMVLSGKLDYLKMVKGGENALYMKLKDRFMSLINQMQGIPELEQVLDIWEEQGIEKAMEIFNPKNQ